jgi:hypothetical protein
MRKITMMLAALIIIVGTVLVSACSGSGGGYRGYASHGIGYGRYYGARPWGYYPGYVDVDPDFGVDDGPVAMPLPEMGMPDMGGMDMGMGMDMGGFDF